MSAEPRLTDDELEASIDDAYAHVIDPNLTEHEKRNWFLVMVKRIRQRSPEQILRMETQLRLVRGKG